MGDNKVVKFPILGSERRRNQVGKLGVPCMVSMRWLSFGEYGAGPFLEGEYLTLDVMTIDTEDEARKLCSLIVTREDLLRAIGNVEEPLPAD